MAKKRVKKKISRKVSKKTKGRSNSNKDKNSKVLKLKRLAKLNARRRPKKGFFAKLFGK